MAASTKTGSAMRIYAPNPTSFVEVKDSGAKILRGKWYEVVSKGTGSAITLEVGDIFKGQPATDLDLVDGDFLYQIDLGEPVAITECTIPFTQGTNNVTDNQSEGFTSYKGTGFTDLSGTISGFTKYNRDGSIERYSMEMLNRFVNVIKDKGNDNYADAYERSPADNDQDLLAFICVNDDAKATQMQQWLITYIIISGYDLGGNVTEAQKRDLSYMKGKGPVTLYQRKAHSSDVL